MDPRPDYDTFVAQRSSRLLRFAYLLTRNWATAEDVLQTALVKAWLAWKRLDGDPESYVRRVIVRTYLSWRRRRWHGEVAHAELPEPQPADDSDGYARRDALWRAMATLPPRQRAALALRYFEDLSEEQTARTLGISVGAVKSQVSKAVARLRDEQTLRATFDVPPLAR